MKYKIWSLFLVLAIAFPILGGLSNASTTEAAWTDTSLNVTIHTKNISNLPVYDQNGVVNSAVNVSGNKDFAATSARRDSTTGNVYYKIGDNEYLSSSEVLAGIPNLVVNAVNATVTTKNGTIQLYDGNGNMVTGSTVDGNSSWYTNQQVDIQNGLTYYQISTNRYISSNDVTSTTAA